MNATEQGDASGSHEVELNLSSFIDCFTVLITYLLISTSFLNLGGLDIVLATPTAGEIPNPPLVSLELNIGDHGQAHIKISGMSSQEIDIPDEGGKVALSKLDSELKQIKQKYPTLDSILVAGSDKGSYDQLVKAIQKAESNFGSVAFNTEAGGP